MSTKSNKAKPSHLYSSLSMAIVMFLLGLFFLLVLHSHNLTNIIKERMNIIVELNEDTDVLSIQKKLESIPSIRKESIKSIPKSEALREMNKNFNMLFEESENPFNDVITFNVKSTDYTETNLNSIKSKIENIAGVRQVFTEDVTIGQIKQNLNRFAYIILFVGGVFVFLAIIIMRNTINLSMYADRWEIKTMELVGAKWNFIKMPYIKTSVIVGFKAFLIAAILIILLIVLIYFYLPILWEVVNILFTLLALIGILVLSIIIPAITTNSAANKYLSKTFEGLYD